MDREIMQNEIMNGMDNRDMLRLLDFILKPKRSREFWLKVNDRVLALDPEFTEKDCEFYIKCMDLMPDIDFKDVLVMTLGTYVKSSGDENPSPMYMPQDKILVLPMIHECLAIGGDKESFSGFAFAVLHEFRHVHQHKKGFLGVQCEDGIAVETWKGQPVCSAIEMNRMYAETGTAKDGADEYNSLPWEIDANAFAMANTTNFGISTKIFSEYKDLKVLY